MDDQGFLRDLARATREEEAEERQRWDRWDRLNDGALSPEEESELRALAAASVEDEQAFEAFRPLDSDFRARIVATIGPLVQGAAAPAEAAPPVEAPVREERPQPALESKSRRGFQFPWWRLGFLGSGLAAATAMLFALRLPPLPAITIATVASGVETKRGEETDDIPVLLAGTGFHMSAQPAAKLSPRANIEPLCYVRPEQPSGSKLLVAPCRTAERHPRTGALRIEGSLPADLPTGSATLWIVLAYSGRQPPSETIEHLSTAAPTRMRTWDAEPIPIEVQSP